MPQFGDYQNEIYLKGLQGIRPALPVDFKGLEARAAAALPPSVLTYVQGGCGDEATQRRNVEAFAEWGIVPRMLVDTRVRDLSVEVFGKRYPSPLMMSWRPGQPPARVKARPDRSIPRKFHRAFVWATGWPVKPSLNCPSAALVPMAAMTRVMMP